MEAVDLLAQIESILLVALPGLEVSKEKLELSAQLPLVSKPGKFSKTPTKLFALLVARVNLNGRRLADGDDIFP
jgi:hypothetical protein